MVDVCITVDVRERKLIHILGEDAHTKALDMGDVLVNLTQHEWVFERKTLSDLAASIKDGLSLIHI